jgi:hypothetical protein
MMVSGRSQIVVLRRVTGTFTIAASLAFACAACEDDSAASGATSSATASAEPQAEPKPTAKPGPSLDERCDELGKACGQKDKHKEQIAAKCKEAAKAQSDKGCVDQARAAYDCYQKDICTKDAKIWGFDDFRVLTERHDKCVAERKAAHKCVTGSDEP